MIVCAYHSWFAWHPVWTEDAGWAWLRFVWRRKEFLGPRTAKIGDPDLMFWVYRVRTADA